MSAYDISDTPRVGFRGMAPVRSTFSPVSDPAGDVKLDKFGMPIITEKDVAEEIPYAQEKLAALSGLPMKALCDAVAEAKPYYKNLVKTSQQEMRENAKNVQKLNKPVAKKARELIKPRFHQG